jgi:hypothetical protein
MDVRLASWRQLVWPTELPWAGYEPLDLPHVPAARAWQPQRVACDALAPWEARQIIDALAAGAEASRRLETLSELFSRLDEVYEGARDVAEYVLGSPVEWWDVLEVGRAPRDTGEAPDDTLLLYGIDCGVVFEGRSERRVGSIAQGALWCEEHPPLWKALARSQATIRTEMPESGLARVALNGAVCCPSCARLREIWKTDFDDTVGCGDCGATFDAVRVMRGR